MHNVDKIVKFPANYKGIYLSKPDKKFSRKVTEEGESHMNEGFKNYKPLSTTRRVLANNSTIEH